MGPNVSRLHIQQGQFPPDWYLEATKRWVCLQCKVLVPRSVCCRKCKRQPPPLLPTRPSLLTTPQVSFDSADHIVNLDGVSPCAPQSHFNLVNLPPLKSILQFPAQIHEHIPKAVLPQVTCAFNDSLSFFLDNPAVDTLKPLTMFAKCNLNSVRAGRQHRHQQAAKFRGRLDTWQQPSGAAQLWCDLQSRAAPRAQRQRAEVDLKAKALRLCREGALSKAVKALEVLYNL